MGGTMHLLYISLYFLPLRSAIFPLYFLYHHRHPLTKVGCTDAQTIVALYFRKSKRIFALFIQVMNNQEAVHLIWHIEDPQEAAECLAKEALARRSKSSISCLIMRFD
jgi:hypothetical protein